MQPTVYLETSVVSYLAAEPSTNIIVAGNQAVTREWWRHREKYQLYISPFVVNEAKAGDAEKAERRLELLAGIPILEVSEAAASVATSLLEGGLLPPKAVEDALHIAVAAENGIEYLVTWNCRHIANAVIRPRVEHRLREAGLEPPTICTPQEFGDV